MLSRLARMLCCKQNYIPIIQLFNIHTIFSKYVGIGYTDMHSTHIKQVLLSL